MKKTSTLAVLPVAPVGTAKRTATPTKTMEMTTTVTNSWERFMTWCIVAYASLLGGFLISIAFGGC